MPKTSGESQGVIITSETKENGGWAKTPYGLFTLQVNEQSPPYTATVGFTAQGKRKAVTATTLSCRNLPALLEAARELHADVPMAKDVVDYLFSGLVTARKAKVGHAKVNMAALQRQVREDESATLAGTTNTMRSSHNHIE